jgi:hypothetical protein
MIKLVFVLLNDKNSQNTINILEFLNEYINELNKKQFYVEIFPIDKNIIETDKFKKFRESNNVQSIPSLIVMKNNDINTISNANNVASFLENILINNNNNNNNINDTESLNSSDEIENYMTQEVCNKNFDRNEDVLSTGHDDSTLIKKMKEFNSKKGIDNTNNTNNINNSNNTNNLIINKQQKIYNNDNDNDTYSEKLFNKAQKKNKFLDNLDDI